MAVEHRERKADKRLGVSRPLVNDGTERQERARAPDIRKSGAGCLHDFWIDGHAATYLSEGHESRAQVAAASARWVGRHNETYLPIVSTPLEDYALIGDCETAALVSRDGSIDWLCLPRFDSGACFAALLGDTNNGHWQITVDAPAPRITRRYLASTLVLETEYTTATGRVAVIDFMPVRQESSDVVRIIEGREGVVPMRVDLVIRFDYGKNVPWVRKHEDGSLRAIAGPDGLRCAHRLRSAPPRGPATASGMSAGSSSMLPAGAAPLRLWPMAIRIGKVIWARFRRGPGLRPPMAPSG